MQLCKNTSVKNKWECLLWSLFSFCLSLSAHGNIWLLNGILRLIWTSLITRRCCPNELFSAWIQKTQASCYVRGNIMLRHHVTGQIGWVLLPTSNAKPYAAQHPFLNIWGVLRSSQIILPDVRLFKAGSQFDNQRIMHSFNSVILWRSFTGRRFIGGKVTYGQSVRTFFAARNGEDIQLQYVHRQVNGSPAVARMWTGKSRWIGC